MDTKQKLKIARDNLHNNIVETYAGTDPIWFIQSCEEIAVTFTTIQKYVTQDVFKKYNPQKPTSSQIMAVDFYGLNKEAVDSLKTNPDNVLKYTLETLLNKRAASDDQKNEKEQDRTKRYDAMAHILLNKDSSLAQDIENYCRAKYNEAMRLGG